MAASLSGAAEGTHSLSGSLLASTGFFPIRAPLTLDDDSSDFQSDGYRTDYSDSVASTSIGNESVSFASGEEEFETASEKHFVGYSDEENIEEGGFIVRYGLSRAPVGEEDEESIENSSVVEGENRVTEEHGLVGLGSELVRPIAQLSLDDDFDELAGDSSEVESDRLSGVLQISSFGVQERVDSAPRVKALSGEEEEEGEEDELLVQTTSVVGQSDMFSSGADGLLEHGAFGSEYDAVSVQGPVEDYGSVNLVEDDCVDGVQSVVIENLMDSQKDVSSENLELEEDMRWLSPGILLERDRDFTCESIILEDDSFIEKLDVIDEAEDAAVYKSPVLEDFSKVEPMVETNNLQIMELLSSSDLPEPSKGNRPEYTWDGSTDSFGVKNEGKRESEETEEHKFLLSDKDIEDIIFGHSGVINDTMNESLQILASHSGADIFQDNDQGIDGQIVTSSNEEEDTVKEFKGDELFNFAQLSAFLKAATGAKLEESGATKKASDDSSAISFEAPSRSQQLFNVPEMVKDVRKKNLSEDEKRMIGKMQQIRVKFLRLVHRLGHSPDDSIVAQVLHRLDLLTGASANRAHMLETAKRIAMELEAEEENSLEFTLNILVIGKTGVGKSATINSILGNNDVPISAFEPATRKVKEIVGKIDGVVLRIIDTPGLKSAVKEEGTNRRILASIKKFAKKFPPDVVLYVDRLDNFSKDLIDLPLLKLLTGILTKSIWQNGIITLTHAASPPPDGFFASPLTFETFVSERSRVVQRGISEAVGDPFLMHPSMGHPVALVENHILCQKNEKGENVLPNGQSWRSQLLMVSYSLKILSEANSILKPQYRSDCKKSLGWIPLPHLLSTMLQSRSHPKLTAEMGGDNVDSDIETLSLSDANEEEDEYDLLPSFKPLGKSEVDELSKVQKKAYFEEYDYRVQLLQKKQWREEVNRLKEIKKKSKDNKNDGSCIGEDLEQEDEGPATMPVALPDIDPPLTFDSDNTSYRYRKLQSEFQHVVRPVLDPQGWDHDCGYDGISLETHLAVANQFPGVVAVQIKKDKKEFNIHLDSSVCAKHGEKASTMAGFDIQAVGRKLAYILRSETKLKNLRMNKTSAGLTIALVGENIATGLKFEDQIAVGKCWGVAGKVGAMTSRGNTAYAANLETSIKSKDFPIDQDQSTLGLSLLRWKDDVGMMANLQSQFAIGRNAKMAVTVGMNNKRNGQVSIKISSSELQMLLISIVPVVTCILKSFNPSCNSGKTKGPYQHYY